MELFRTPTLRAALGTPQPGGKGLPELLPPPGMFATRPRSSGIACRCWTLTALWSMTCPRCWTGTRTSVGWRPHYRWGNPRIGGGRGFRGTHTHVWEDFTPEAVVACRKAGYRGRTGGCVAAEGVRDVAGAGQRIFQSQDFLKKYGVPRKPKGARIIHFNGRRKRLADAARTLDRKAR